MIKKIINEFWVENKYDICMVSMLLIIGFACGIGIYFMISDNTTSELVLEVKKTFDLSLTEKIEKLCIISNSLKINSWLVIALVFFSITVIGRWLIYSATIVKGMAIGIYTCILFSVFNFWWGIVTAILLVAVVNLIYIPAYIFISTTLLCYNFELFNTKKESISMFSATKMLLKVMSAFMFIFSSSVVEQVLTNVVFKIYQKIAG